MAFHFITDRNHFFHAINAQQNIASKKGTLAILSNILIQVERDKIIVTGTDLEIGLKQVIPAEVIEPGTLTLPAKKLFEIARESNSITLTFQEKDNQWVDISAGPSLYKLAGMSSDEFPQFPKYNENNMVRMESSIMADLIDKTVFSIANDKENMYTLTAALICKEEEGEKKFLKMISSDGHRLTMMKKEVDERLDKIQLNPVTLIPKRSIQEIRKFCEDIDSFMIGLDQKQAILKSEDSLLIIRLMEGEFPDIQRIIDTISMENIIEIDRLRFLESLKRINLFTEDMFKTVKIEIADNNILLTSQNADLGSAKDEFNIKYNGDPLSLGFNCRYLIETLQVMEGNIIKAVINSDESPCLIISDDDEGFSSIVMPMKL